MDLENKAKMLSGHITSGSSRLDIIVMFIAYELKGPALLASENMVRDRDRGTIVIDGVLWKTGLRLG